MLKERLLFKRIEPYLDSKEAIVITGMRRTGKTSLLQFIYNRIKSANKLFLDLENPLNQKYFEELDYERIKSNLEILGLNFSAQTYLFLDEIQLTKNLPSVIKYLIDHYKVKCFLTGSASFYLKNLFTESLAGRKYLFELFPLTFPEFLLFKESKLTLPKNSKLVTPSIFEKIATLYEEYIQFGGFPEIVLKKSVSEKKKSLSDIFSSFFQAEVLRLGDFKKNKIIRDLMIILMERIGSKLDIQRLAQELGIARPTLYDYLAFLEGTYFIKLIRPFSKSKDVEIRKMPKVYLCDSGLANHFAKLNDGLLFENNVFQNLRIKGEVNYYQRKSGLEIDFILNQSTAYEVKITPHTTDINRLRRISKELGLKKFRVVAKKYSSLKNVDYGFLL
ncbi:MAG: ATP-binding protein [candidate division WOR-3 bacterium]|nr:ATP-binding protein [candidate division WOR-3 bacterium]